MPDFDLNDLIDLHGTLREVLTPHAFDALARAILAGHHEEAMGILGAYAIPDPLTHDRASAGVDALIALAQSGRGACGTLDGPGVCEDLTMQPCQADVREMALSGHFGAAALIAMIHEGYSGAGALAAMGIIVDAESGVALDLHEVPLADIEAGGSDAYAVRMGKDLVAGHFVDAGGAVAFEAASSGRRHPLARISQAWKAVPRG